MKILKHRVNSIDDVNPEMDLEIDVRDFNNELVLSHDHPNTNSLKLEDFLNHVSKNQLLAINIKSSEIEDDLFTILDDQKISNYFTFDWSIPSLLNALKKNLICAFRLSEYEKDIIPNCSWVWIDSFKSIWYDDNFLNSLKNSGLKLAIVSPELHNRKSDLEQVKEIVNSVKVDAICTDLPEFWY
ncbi:hypothetical protein [Nitrosopumilus sp. b2]|uniref:hypothetical protein n=1 Tax=Nitrosopumilus sp. b2 TaxID=2109908 RepID=UPI0015F67B50|nr:hypothetical protein [Nitrosopumilus sp. b2]KAF6245773.1 hypothetical protein C6989_01150 [Nitrosopumilus sp. b2]